MLRTAIMHEAVVSTNISRRLRVRGLEKFVEIEIQQ
jgi:hypothetical protein